MTCAGKDVGAILKGGGGGGSIFAFSGEQFCVIAE